MQSLEDHERAAMLATYGKGYLLDQCPIRIQQICERPMVTVVDYVNALHDGMEGKSEEILEAHMQKYADDYDINFEPLYNMAYYEKKFGTFEEVMFAYYGNWVAKLHSSKKWEKNVQNTNTSTKYHYEPT